METKLARITEIAKERPNEKFTSLAHLINRDALIECHQQMSSRKAPGVDGVTRAKYGENLQENIDNLISRMKSQAYKPQPAKRSYIPKLGTNKQRPLGMPVYEDKLVQSALSKILESIYEADFLDLSFGFRPGKGCHDALKALNHIIEERNINYVLDADIKGFFDHVDHKWLMEFLKHRIADTNLLRIIARFLKAGILEAEVTYDTPEGVPQGGPASPIMANVYLHYALDLWFEKVVKPRCKGEAYMIRYADDFVCCFEHESEAKGFYQALVKRLGKFNLEIAEEKTRIIPFGRNAQRQCQGNGKSKPDTFDFLVFTHYCSKSQKGRFRVKRKTSRKKMKASLMRCKHWLKMNRNLPITKLMHTLRIKLEGYYRYYCITDNTETVGNFYDKVRKMLFKWLNRRSQRKSFSWDKYVLFLARNPLPRPRVLVNIYDFQPQVYGLCPVNAGMRSHVR